ncbi:MAG TPA: penicillin-binding protein 1C [Vicinamibacteria bacterium]|nr:penicillin-binding protein 1C [Vicinamibacteria bacterium]
MKRRLRFALAGLAALSAAGFWRCLPEPLFEEPTSVVLLDRDGLLLGARIADDDQWRFPPIPSVPEKLRWAITTYEDKRFFSHPGVDPLAIARAMHLNLSRGRVVSGGSTLTMQVIRLARSNRDRTYLEKLVEAILALRLELRYDKDDILALWASHAPFGGNVVGLEAAAWRYFGRPPGSLSWAEAATLAVLPNAPTLVHPGKNRETLERKRNALLTRLNAAGRIDALELALALREPLPLHPHPLPRKAPHLLATLSSETRRHRFESTLSASLQDAVQRIVSRLGERLGSQGIDNVAVLVVDNQSFEVLAYVGNTEWSVEEDRGYAVDVIQRPRSTGSILKPFLFASMIQAGEILSTTLVPDVPVQYAGYMPENFDRAYRGAVPAEVALAQSLNVPAVHMLKHHGVNRFYDSLEGFGMTTLWREPEGYGLTLILGGAEGTLWDITSMYANLAHIARQQRARPQQRRLRLLQGEEDATGKVAEIGPGAAWLTLKALVEVARPGDEGHWRSFTSARPIAWKTGTSFGLRDGWAVGTTNRYTVGVWVGNANGEGRPGLTGATAAAPVLFDVFGRLDNDSWFMPPYRFMKELDVCKSDGFLASGGCETERQWAPAEAHFERQSPYHRRIHLDPSGRFRVDSACESPSAMMHRSWFVLPPNQEFYFRRYHADYRPLPPYRNDCRTAMVASDGGGPIDFLYPHAGTRLYIPLELSGNKGRTVFEAVHRDPDATLHWHLDDGYLGTTRTFHQQALDMEPGWHQVTVVDAAGNRLSRRFEVLGRGN